MNDFPNIDLGVLTARQRLVELGQQVTETVGNDDEGGPVSPKNRERYVQSGVNKGAHVQIVGHNIEGEPIVQRLDGLPLEWPAGHQRHVLDVPPNMLGDKPPVPSLLEAAEAVVAQMHYCTEYSFEYASTPHHWPLGYPFDALAAAVERERAPL